MLRNVDTPVNGPDGKPFVEAGAPFTVKTAAVNALMTSNEGSPTGVQKAERYRLAVRLLAGGEVDLSPEDLALVKTLVGAAYLPFVVGQVFDWADPETNPKGR